MWKDTEKLASDDTVEDSQVKQLYQKTKDRLKTMKCHYVLLYLLLPASSAFIAIWLSEFLPLKSILASDTTDFEQQIKAMAANFKVLTERVENLSNSGARTSLELGKLKRDVQNLTSTVEDHEHEMSGHFEHMAALKQTTGFTARMSIEDVSRLTVNQTVRFDHVLFNAGGGYDPSTGAFSAPMAGTYVFFLQALNYGDRESRILLDLLKNGEHLARMHAGWSPFESGSTLTVTHLAKGDVITVQVALGSAFWGGVFSSWSGFRVS